MLELELGDFKFVSQYRIGVVDQDMLTIKDVNLGQWPVAVVTNPKVSTVLRSEGLH